VKLAAANPATFAADSSVAKALGNGIAMAAHVSPDRVVVSLRAELDLMQVLDNIEPGLVQIEHRVPAGKAGSVLMGYAITLPAYEASQSDFAVKALKSQTPASLGRVLASEVGKLSHGAAYVMQVLEVETPKAAPVDVPIATKSAAHVWKPLASALPAVVTMLVCGTH